MIRLLVNQRRAIHLLFIFVLFAGFISLKELGREELPEPVDEYDGMTITAQLPGAGPEEVDRRIARPIHDALKSMEGVKEVESNASEGLLSARVRFKTQALSPAALSRDISQRVNQINDFPDEIEGLTVSQFKARIWEDMSLVFVGGDDLGRHQQWRWVEERLRSLPGIAELQIKGDRERRIEVRLNGLNIAAAGSRIDKFANELQSTLAERVAGRVESTMNLHQLRVETRPDSTDALSAMTLDIDGTHRPLQQLASVQDVLEPARVKIHSNGQEGWYVRVYREPGSNIETISASLRVLINDINRGFEKRGEEYRIVILKDRSEMVKKSFSELQSSIAIGICLVMLVLWLFVGFSNALYAAIGIPFAFLASFIVMQWLGLNLNLLTLFGLILVCGMVVDDTIVVLENVLRHKELGANNLEALSRGIREVAPSVIVATATTIAAFFPLLLMTGDLGEFLSSIPKVTIIALLASLVECFIILPVHLYSRNKSGKKTKPLLHGIMERAANYVAGITLWVINHAGRSFLLLLVIVVTTILMAGNLHFSLAKETEIRALNVAIEFSHNTDINTVSASLKQAEIQLQQFRPAIDKVVSMAGWRKQAFHDQEQPYLATMELFLSTESMAIAQARPLLDQVLTTLRQHFPATARLSVTMDANKPADDSAVKVYVYANTDTNLIALTEQLSRGIRSINGVRDLEDPFGNGIREKVFQVDHGAARRYGIGPGDIARLMHLAVTGREVGKMELNGILLPVHVIGSDARYDGLRSLSHIALADGRQLPVSQIGRFDFRESAAVIKRLNGNRFLIIEGSIDTDKTSVRQVQQDIEQLLQTAEFPMGSWAEQKGDFSGVAESLASMGQAAMMAVGLCYLLLTLLCRSYIQPFIVLFSVPLALMGVVWGQWLSGDSLSLLGVAGVIGLIGIVLNDALVWIGFYNQYRAEAGSAVEAACETVRRRFRPICLTTLTTVLALLPAAIMGAGIVTDIARITVFGLSGATILLILFFPLFVVSVERWRDKFQLLSGRMIKIATDYSGRSSFE